MQEVNPDYTNAVAAKQKIWPTLLEPAKKKFIEENILPYHSCPVCHKHLDTILCHHDVVSHDKFDFGQTDILLHEIALLTEKPIYVKQFKIPDKHWEYVKQHFA